MVPVRDDRDAHMDRDAIEDLRGEIRYHPYQDIVEKQGQKGHSTQQEITHLLFLFRFLVTQITSISCSQKLLRRCDGHKGQGRTVYLRCHHQAKVECVLSEDWIAEAEFECQE